MSHVDEGALHAYLDGALDEYPPADAERIRSHLDTCAECAERLEVERRIRSDAHAFLGLAAPTVDVPSFEELRAYVQRTRQGRNGISRLQRLGWAASIVVALGAGWMLREGQLQTRALDIGGEMAPAAREDAGAARLDEAADIAAPVVGAPAPSAQEVPTAGREGGSRPASAPAVDVAPPTFVDGDGGRAPDRAEAQVVGAAALEATDDETARRFLRLAKMDDSAALASPRPAVADAWAGSAALGEVPAVALIAAGTGADTVPAEVDAVPADVVAGMADASSAADTTAPVAVVVTGAGVAGEPAERQERSAPSITSALTTAQAEARRRAPSTETTEEEVDAEPLLSVPGHEVLDVTNLGEGSTPLGVRVRQRTPAGRTFEVFHLEPGIDPAILPELGADGAEARTETPFGWVLVRGPMSQDQLGELLQRLLPPSS